MCRYTKLCVERRCRVTEKTEALCNNELICNSYRDMRYYYRQLASAFEGQLRIEAFA